MVKIEKGEDKYLRTAGDWRIGRRNFLQTAAVGALALGFGALPVAAEDPKNTHNMLRFFFHTCRCLIVSMQRARNSSRRTVTR